MHRRHISQKIEAALLDTPAVLINGARQTGKSTLVKWLAENHYPATYFNLDNATTLAMARLDPTQFIGSIDAPTIIDEIQRVPALLLAIKESIDNNRHPGRFLLTGSANVLQLPKISDSLAGRMEIINLWPLSQGEINNTTDGFIDQIFKKTFSLQVDKTLARNTLIENILLGGYPEILTRQTIERRYAWYNSYITAILQRDIRDIAHIEGLTQLPRLLSLLATRTGCLLNVADIARLSTIASTTLNRYLTLLQTIFLIYLMPAWSNNYGKRIIKAPKLYLCDTGLSAHLSGITTERIHRDNGLLGPLLENFVAMELVKQLGWSKIQAKLFHYRTTTGQEVDFILENAEGACVGIEVKASATLSAKQCQGLLHLAEILGEKFVRGIVLYTGQEILPLRKNLYAVPIHLLWQ